MDIVAFRFLVDFNNQEKQNDCRSKEYIIVTFYNVMPTASNTR